MELRSGKLVQLIGIIASLITTILIYVLSSVIESNDSGGQTAVVLMIIGFGATAAYLLLHYYRYRIRIDYDKMEITNEFGRKRTLDQDDIRSVDHQKLFNMIVINTRWGKKIKISTMYSRFLELIPEEKWSEKLKNILQ